MTLGFNKLAWLFFILLCSALLNACSTLKQFDSPVAVRSMNTDEYIRIKRGDVLTSNRPSAASIETIKVAGLDVSACLNLDNPGHECIAALLQTSGINDERRLSTLSELWVQQALSTSQTTAAEARLHAWLQAARYAYAYLFFTNRSAGERAFEDRQTQVRDYYNLAVQETATILFEAHGQSSNVSSDIAPFSMSGWLIKTDLSGTNIAQSEQPIHNLFAAPSLAFTGLRSQYRRDGFGAELVVDRSVKTNAGVLTRNSDSKDHVAARPTWSEMPYPVVTALLRFESDSLADILATTEVTFAVYDPYRYFATQLYEQHIPLAGHFTAGYGLWLAQAGFARQSIRTLLGREQNFDKPHVYLMQPYDPDRRVILMIHGLASSPEAWVNVANEIMGDEILREKFQVWQVYYPTNIPIPINHFEIRNAINAVFHHYDPQGSATASNNMVVIGHSMGGVIARLMVSSSDNLMHELLQDVEFKPKQLQRIEERLGPILKFSPMPEVSRAIFITAPHRGTPFAGQRLGRFVAGMIKLPLTILEDFADVLQGSADASGTNPKHRLYLPNSIDNLKADDSFILASAKLPISSTVDYHSIIARTHSDGKLEDSDDGLVPYQSAHLPEAVSETVIVSGHSVQETAAAILEIKRILFDDLENTAAINITN